MSQVPSATEADPVAICSCRTFTRASSCSRPIVPSFSFGPETALCRPTCRAACVWYPAQLLLNQRDAASRRRPECVRMAGEENDDEHTTILGHGGDGEAQSICRRAAAPARQRLDRRGLRGHALAGAG